MESEARENLLETVKALERVIEDRDERLLVAQRRIAELMETIQALEAGRRGDAV